VGTDIHLLVEVYDGKSWKYQEPPTIELYYYPKTMTEPEMGTYWYWGRNYNLFALLADVRNGLGFAGTDTGDAIRPINDGLPRAKPDDLSPEGEHWWVTGYGEAGCPNMDRETGDGCAMCNANWPGYHDFTWHTLRDLVHADYDQVQTKRGWVDAMQYTQFLREGRPSSWSGSISGGSIKHVTNAQMDAGIVDGTIPLVGDGGPMGGGSHYTQVQWSHPLRESMGTDWFEFLDRLKPLTHDDGTDVRVLISFDS
jgi:hypothetical protein